MTGNKAYLAEYQDFNGGPIAFGGSKGYITGKCKIKTGKLDIEDVCFVKELQHFNLFYVSQMCDKKNKVLFTDSECLILSPEFKLPDANQPQNKTPYELVTGKIPIISYIRPFGCLVTILNTIDHLGKFDGKSDEGIGPTWLFDLDYLTDSMSYQPVRSVIQANKHAGPQEANQNAGTEDNIDAGDSEIEAESAQDYFVLPISSSYTLTIKSSKDANDAAEALRKEFAQETEDLLLQAGAAKASSTNIVNTASTPVSTTSPYGGLSFTDLTNTDQDDSEIPALH
ncbi:hypothetical protein Tco_0792413 [Tanacetum coccineum]